MFDGVLGRAGDLKGPPLAGDGWLGLCGTFGAAASAGDDLVAEVEWRFARVDVDDGEVGEGQVVVDALVPFLDREPVDDDGGEAGEQCPDRGHRGVGVTALCSNHECVEHAFVAVADRVDGVVECGLSASHGADLSGEQAGAGRVDAGLSAGWVSCHVPTVNSARHGSLPVSLPVLLPGWRSTWCFAHFEVPFS